MSLLIHHKKLFINLRGNPLFVDYRICIMLFLLLQLLTQFFNKLICSVLFQKHLGNPLCQDWVIRPKYRYIFYIILSYFKLDLNFVCSQFFSSIWGQMTCSFLLWGIVVYLNVFRGSKRWFKTLWFFPRIVNDLREVQLFEGYA